MLKIKRIIAISFLAIVVLQGNLFAQKYEPAWESLKRVQTPKWLQDGKFGIYTHWGPYSVHAFGENTTWYSWALYADPNSEARAHFEKKFGKLTPEFGYKDLIPLFTAEKFNAEEWADLFQKSGAKFAGPVAEHHDGFAMWDTKYSEWNAAKMGPKRDIVGELADAIKKRDMKYVTSFHHSANWWFLPVWDKNYDTGNPKYSGLYGQPHEQGAIRTKEALDEWYGKLTEVIDNYSPDLMFFDFAFNEIAEGYVKDYLAYYYNHALDNNKEVVVTYKGHDVVPGSGLRDLELGQERNLTYYEWITDNSVDDRGAWGYAEDLTFKSPNRLIDNLVDRVSKNGYLLLNVGPKPDGSIPEGAKEVLLEMGKWLEVNGDAIYGTTPWTVSGEGPTNLGSGPTSIGFNEAELKYTPKDIRYTVKGDDIYATFLEWPGEVAQLTAIHSNGKGQDSPVIPSWVVLEDSKPLAGKTFTNITRGSGQDEGDQEEEEDDDEDGEEEEEDEDEDEDGGPAVFTFEFTSETEVNVSGGEARDGTGGTYRQSGGLVYVYVLGDTWTLKYDGNTLQLGEFWIPGHPGIYREEIKRITLLGDDQELDWVLTGSGLMIKTPDESKKSPYANVFKIERYHRPQFK